MQNNIDDVPVGGGSSKANDMGDEFASAAGPSSTAADSSGPFE